MSTPACENVLEMPPSRRAYHHGNLRASLIESGLALIEKKGVQALTLREIGARLGVSRSAAYRHFEDKAQLLAAISEAGFEQFADALQAARTSAADNFAARMSAMGLAYVRFAADHRAHFEVMFRPLDPPRMSPAGARAFAILENTIREGQQSGDVRPGDSAALARLVWSMVHGISMLHLGQDAAGRKFTRLCTEILRAGLQPAALL
jgi:AcrR family transcriptional regulator